MITDDELPIDPPSQPQPPFIDSFAGSPVPEDTSVPKTNVPPVNDLPPNDLPPSVKPLAIELRPRTGIRRLRGTPTTVPTGHLDVMVDGYQRAWTRVEVGSLIYALAEFLPHEVTQLQAAVKRHRGDATPPGYEPLPSGSNEELDQLRRA